MRAYTADMIPGGASPVINVSQYDNDYAVTVTLIEGAEIYTPPSGATIRVEGTKPDGHGFEYPCTYQGNVVTMPIYTQMTVVSGRFPIELVVYQNGLRVGSCNIVFAVEKAPLGEDTDISETVIPDIIDAAQSSAEAAQEAAEQAQEAAAQVLSSQIVTDASGSIASFSDGADDVAVKSLVASITPVQNLNGQPNPYPAGGGKNKVPYPTVDKTVAGITYKANEDGSVRVTGTATSEVSQGIGDLFTLPAGTYIYSSGVTESFSTYDSYVSIPGTGTIARGNSNTPGPQFTLTETSQVSINIRVRSGQTVNLTFKPMIRLASVSDGTFAPYSNICPISGRTGLTVTRAGKNLIDDSIKTVQSSATVVIGQTSTTGFDIFLPAGTYAVSFASEKNPSINYRLPTESSGAHAVVSYGNRSGTFTLTESAYLRMWAYLSGGIVPSDITWFQLEAGSTATPYTPYVAPTTYPISWQTQAGTVYGGTLDVVSGVLTVDRAIVDLGDMTWGWSSNGYFFSSTIQNLIEPPKTASGKTTAICSMYKAETTNDIRDNTVDNAFGVVQVNSGVNTGRVWIRDTSKGTDTAAFQTAVTGQTLAYPLATPQTYQLTPTEVRTILGGNNIYTDAGDVSVEYIADTKLYIDGKIAELQALVLEN